MCETVRSFQANRPATDETVNFSDYCLSVCSSRPHNHHQLFAELLLWVGHREEKLPWLHCSDESRHAGTGGLCSLANDGR